MTDARERARERLTRFLSHPSRYDAAYVSAWHDLTYGDLRVISASLATVSPLPVQSEWEICDQCNGAGGDNQHSVCGKCGGQGGYATAMRSAAPQVGGGEDGTR